VASWRPVLAALAAIGIAFTAAGCVSMASGGPVISYAITQGPAGQPQSNPRSFAQGPRPGWTAQDIVQGFLTAASAFGGEQVAKEYLTAQASKKWPSSSGAVTVYSNGPNADQANDGKVNARTHRQTATVTISGTVSANLTQHGTYVIPADSAAAGASTGKPTFTLIRTVGGEWRISAVPPQLLLTTVQFQDAYQQRNLYYFDPAGQVLVPDPVYVPLQATPAFLLNKLVYDLINPQVVNDWLTNGATRTLFPKGTTQLGDVTLDGGTATVNLGGKITGASTRVLEQVSAQLYWTLQGTGQGGPAVQSIQVNRNGKPWTPPDTQGNPVQRQLIHFNPATGGTKRFYYMDRAGYLVSRDGPTAKPMPVTKVGRGVTQLAVSPDQEHLAVVRDGALYTGRIGGKLVRRAGTGYETLSWDRADNLWTIRDGLIVLLQDGAAPVVLPSNSVIAANGSAVTLPFSGLRIAPDGVRVALIIDSLDLKIGAISVQAGSAPRRPVSTIRIQLSPFQVPRTTSFEAVTWYGADNVVTLGQPGPVVAEYPVSGGTPTVPIQGEPTMISLTASAGNVLVAGLIHGGLVYDSMLNGEWAPFPDSTLPDGTAPVYPG
jgi:hypothetical protein